MPNVKPCANRNCKRMTRLGIAYCPEHTRADNRRRWNKSVQHGLATPQWKTKRATILANNPTCACGQPATTAHLDPSWNGNHDAPMSAFTAMCGSCHGTIDAPRATR